MKFGLFSLRGQKAMYTNISRNGMGRFSVDIHEQEVHLELHAMDDKFQTMCRYIILTSHYSTNLVMLVSGHIRRTFTTSVLKSIFTTRAVLLAKFKEVRHQTDIYIR